MKDALFFPFTIKYSNCEIGKREEGLSFGFDVDYNETKPLISVLMILSVRLHTHAITHLKQNWGVRENCAPCTIYNT